MSIVYVFYHPKSMQGGEREERREKRGEKRDEKEGRIKSKGEEGRGNEN